MNPSRDPGAWLRAVAGTVRRPLAGAVAAGLGHGLLTILQAGLAAWIVQRAVVDGMVLAGLVPAFAALLVTMMARVGAGWLQEAAGLAAAHRVAGDIRRRLLDRVATLGPVYLDRPAGEIAGLAVDQVEALEGYYARFLPQAALAVLVPAAILVTVAVQDWLAALLLLAAVPLIPAFMVIVGLGADQLARRHHQAMTRLGGHFLDRLQGLTTLRLLGQAEAATTSVRRAADEYRRRNMATLRIAFLSSAVLEFFSAVAIALVAIYIGFGLLGYFTFGPAPELTLFTGLFILLLAPEVFQPLRILGQHYHDRANALGAARELLAVLHAEPPAPKRPPATALPSRAAALPVTFDDVHVTFPDGRTGLRGITLSVAAGERVALVGPSGAGKSTLLHCLAGFVTPTTGQITAGDASLDPAAQVAWMGQQATLFHGTLATNIRLGRPEACDDTVRAAARQAGVLELADILPAGLDTPVGEGGYGLSGGQARRVALARALLKDAPLLLLDEPTAGLDPAGEAFLVDALQAALAEGPTVLIATHHPALLTLADRVVHIEDGRLANHG